MRPIVIDGKKIAAEIINVLKNTPKPRGFVGVFLNTHDSASESFVKQKEHVARELGIELRQYGVSETDSNDSLRKRVRRISQSKKCIGVILQLPLPRACNISYIANTIPPHKDIDCLSARNVGSLLQSGGNILPPAVRALRHILKSQNKTVQDFNSIAIVGQGTLVGKPIAVWLLGNHPNIHIFDKGFSKDDLKKSDLIILGAGSAGIINGGDVSADAWVIDFGYSRQDEKLMGDFDSICESVDHVGLYTPTPGGTGPILVASLFENLFSTTCE